MGKTFHAILSWSEVYALLIPLAFMLLRRNTFAYLKPVRVYIWIALVLNLFIAIIFQFKRTWNFPNELQSNNFLYNLHSIARFYLFVWFFISLQQPFLRTIKIIVPVLFTGFVLINFIFFEDLFFFDHFSFKLLTIEACLLLLFCLQYYFYVLTAETDTNRRPPAFWVATGLSIYVVINFPIFLFYRAMRYEFRNFVIGIWDVHNIAYIVFCCFLAKAFHEANKYPANNSTLQ